MADLRLLLAVSRDWTRRDRLEDALRPYAVDNPVVAVVTASRGGPTLAAEVARGLGWRVESYRAHWDLRGNHAAAHRDQRMVDRGAAVCLAFPTWRSKQTYDLVARAMAVGIPVEWVLEAGLVPARRDGELERAQRRLARESSVFFGRLGADVDDGERHEEVE